MTPPYETSANLAASTGMRHGFFGRQGGYSEGHYASLNVSERGGDALTPVEMNRAAITQALGYPPLSLAGLTQIHSDAVVTITSASATAMRPEADAMVTALPNIVLGILTADCAPILFADAEAGVIGAAHAGWKGAAAGIGQRTVAAMVALGARPERIAAAIGPSISQANYEVGEDFAEALLASHPDAEQFFARINGGKPHFDLPAFVAADLIKAGTGSVEILGRCTYAVPEHYFSHRYATHHDHPTGRQMSAIVRVGA